jgi:NADH-quinone oxidoreductase subunit F
MLIAAFAIGASEGVLFVNGEARLAYARVARAVADSRAAGLLGPSVLGSGFGFEVQVRRGAGGFILGEETALLECIEGQRAMPRVRPPFPVERGLYGQPTVINNVETLSSVPAIVRNGGAWYATMGHANGSGTKVFSLAGDVARPGVVEVDVGTSVRALVDGVAGGTPDGRPAQAVLVGGPSGRFLPQEWLDEPLAPRGRFGLGSGGITVVGQGRDLASLTRTLLAFNAAESCGKCTPCREGLPRMLNLLDGAEGPAIAALSEIVTFGSLCGLGQAAPLSVESGLAIWLQEQHP